MKKCHCVYQMPSVFCDENMTPMGLQLTKISLSLIGGPCLQSEDSQIKYKFESEIARVGKNPGFYEKTHWGGFNWFNTGLIGFNGQNG